MLILLIINVLINNLGNYKCYSIVISGNMADCITCLNSNKCT